MSWFSRFRRRRRTEDYVGRHRPGSWSEIALPPFEAVAAPVDAEPLETVTAAPEPAVVAQIVDTPPPVIVPSVEVAPRQRIRLGFADGTSVEIEDASGASDELMRVAARLIDDPC